MHFTCTPLSGFSQGTPEFLGQSGFQVRGLPGIMFGSDVWDLAELRVVSTDHQLAQHSY